MFGQSPAQEFTGKERDAEAVYVPKAFGMSVCLSRKLSGVAPMSDKYPEMSPYMYTAGNPVMLVDFSFYQVRIKESFFSLKEVAGSASTNVFVGSSVGRIDYTGGSSNFRACMLYGDRHKGWVSFGESFSAGISGALSKVSGGYIITSEINAGVGVSVIPLIGFGSNQGTISR